MSSWDSPPWEWWEYCLLFMNIACHVQMVADQENFLLLRDAEKQSRRALKRRDPDWVPPA